MVTDTKTNNLRIVLHQIYVSLYVEYGVFVISAHSEKGLMDQAELIVSSYQESALAC